MQTTLEVNTRAVLDASIVENLRTLQRRCDRDLLGDIARLFGQESAPLEMSEAHSTGDLERLGALAHRVKGSASSVGALDLALLCNELEVNCKRRRPSSVDDVETIHREYKRVAASLSALSAAGTMSAAIGNTAAQAGPTV